MPTDRPARIVVVDDHGLFRSGLITLIDSMPFYQVVGEAESGEDALGVISDTDPDLVLIDVNMPGMGGIELVRALRETGDSLDLVMLTISRQEEDLLGAIRAGADGYILKNAEPDELKAMLDAVQADQSVISPELTGAVFKAVRTGHLEDPADILTAREKDVLRCLADGLTTAQTAEKLVISRNTVKTHVRHILEKLEVSNRAEAVSVAIKRGVLA
jgi:DNA-binding NarL/FixJ family response regulator